MFYLSENYYLTKEDGEKDGSRGKSTGCSFRRSKFDSDHPHGYSQPFVIPV